jgi:hypothetical protein
VKWDSTHPWQQPLKIVKTAMPESTTQIKDKMKRVTAKTVQSDKFSQQREVLRVRIVPRERSSPWKLKRAATTVHQGRFHRILAQRVVQFARRESIKHCKK